MKTILSLLLLTGLAIADDGAALVDQLFDRDPVKRAAARERLLAMESDVLAKVLARIEERQTPKATLLQVYAVKDLVEDNLLWPATLERLRALDAEVREQENGVLVVVATKDVHGRIAAILTELRHQRARVITISSALVELPKGTEIPRGFAKGELGRWIENHHAELKELPTLICRNGQRVEISAMQPVSYIADFDVEVAQGTFIADPVIDTLPRGIQIQVRPIVGSELDLHLEVRFGHVQEPLKEAELAMPAGPAVRIQTPESRTVQIRTSRRVANGASTVIDLGEGSMLVVTAVVIDLDE